MVLQAIDYALFIAALWSLVPITSHMRVLARLRSGGRPEQPFPPFGFLKWVSIAITYGLPFLLNAWLLLIVPLSIGTMILQLIVTSTMASLGLTLTLLHMTHRLNAKYDKSWVKMLDFPYLALAVLGLYRILETSYGQQSILGKISIAALALAIAIRLTKATIEAFFDSWVGQ